MKKKVIGLLACVVAAASLAAGCANSSGGGGGNENPSQGGEEQQQDAYAIRISGAYVNTMDIGEETELSWKVTKNGAEVDGEEALVNLVGDSVSYDAETGKIKAVKKGTTTVTVTLKNNPDVSSTPVTYKVMDYFFARGDLSRGTVNFTNEENNEISIVNGQATALVKKPSTHFKFNCKINLPDNFASVQSQSFGIGSFIDNGDSAIWFGLRNETGDNNNTFGLYLRNFYNGWGNATADRIEAGYGSVKTGNTIEFEIIRDGADYYYDINGCHGKYTDNTDYDKPTYPGIYSQELAFSVTDFTVTYDEDEIAAAAGAYSDKPVGAVVINESNARRLLRGFSYNFTASVYPSYSTGEIVWELDKSGLTAGADNTTVTDGLLHIADDAAGTVLLICKSGNVEDSLQISVLEEPDDAENDIVKVTGGVQLDEDGTVIFPEALSDIAGFSSETEYNTNEYSALLKQNVSKDFSVEFTVSDYKVGSGVGYPKLQVSLGYKSNNFYIAYYDGYARIETYTYAVYEDGKVWEGWHNSNNFENFDKNAPHTFKISVNEQGEYTVYLDGSPLTFTAFSTGESVRLLRNYEAYSQSLPVRIATGRGVSAKISGITVTDGTAASVPEFWKYNNNTVINENGFTTTFTDASWDTRDRYVTRVIATTPADKNCTVEFDVEFSDAMTDAKFVLKTGNWEYHVNNTLAAGNGSISGYIYKNSWGGSNVDATNTALVDMLKAHVRLERNGGAVRLIVNGVVIGEANGADNSSLIEFYAFNGNSSEKDYTVTVSNINIGEYQRLSDLYEIVLTGNAVRELDVDDSDNVIFETQCDGTAVNDCEYDYTVSDGGVISFDEATGKVTALAEGVATLTVTLRGHDEARPLVITYNISDYFFNKTVIRGEVDVSDEANGSVTVNGGQATLVAKKSDTYWVFSATLTLDAYDGGESVGIGSFVDNGDHALWVGIKNGNNGTYEIGSRDFFGGWAGTEANLFTGCAMAVDGVVTIDALIVRNGNTYYYCIGGYMGILTADYANATYPGVYSQTKPMTVSGFEVAYGQEEALKKIAELGKTAVTSVSINQKGENQLTAGSSYSYTATKTPSFSEEQLVWNVDTSLLTAGSATVDNGTLTLSSDAVGVVTVKVSNASGTVEDSLEITVTEKPRPTENDLLTVSGGVLLDEDGTLTFHESYKDVNGVGDETAYVANDYSANFKQTVKGDFSIEFTVSDYKAYAEYPKLMISLGGVHNQFYVAYKNNGEYRVETFTNTVNSFNSYWQGGSWCNSANFTDFDKDAAHTYKIECVNGIYHVYMDGTELAFNVDGAAHGMARRVEDYTSECPIRISTNGVSCKVSDIRLTRGEVADWFYTNTSNVTGVSENGFTLKSGSANYSWDKKDNYINRIVYTAGVAANCTVEYDLTLSGTMQDGKFITIIGGKSVMINDANGAISCNVNDVGYDWAADSVASADVYKVKIVRADDNIKVYINGTLIKDYNSAGSDGGLEFWVFNNTAGEEDISATVTNLTVTGN